MPRKYLLSDLRFALNFVHLAAFLIISSVSLGSHASIIDTSATWDGSFNICCFGSPNFATGTFGQVFTTPADPVLLNYAFELSNRSVTPHPTVRFDTYIFQWAGDRATGAPLFSQPGNTIPFDDRGGFHEFAFATGGLILSPGQQYVAVIDTSPYGTFTFESAAMAAIPTNVLPGDFFYFQDSRGTFANLANFPWSCGDEGSGCRYHDAVFKASFATVPIPSAVWMFGWTLCVMGTWYRTAQKKMRVTELDMAEIAGPIGYRADNR